MSFLTRLIANGYKQLLANTERAHATPTLSVKPVYFYLSAMQMFACLPGLYRRCHINLFLSLCCLVTYELSFIPTVLFST